MRHAPEAWVIPSVEVGVAAVRQPGSSGQHYLHHLVESELLVVGLDLEDDSADSVGFADQLVGRAGQLGDSGALQ